MLAATISNMPALMVIDRLNISGNRGIFVRGQAKDVPRLLCESPDDDVTETKEMIDEFLSTNTIDTMHLSVAVCGLMGNPPNEIVDEWERMHYVPTKILEFFKRTGYREKGVYVRLVSGHFRIRESGGFFRDASESDVIHEIVNLMGDRNLKGTHLTFSFDISTQNWSNPEVMEVCDALDLKSPEDVDVSKCASGYGVRTFVYEPVSSQVGSTAMGGVHVSLDCGDFIAQWHTLTHIESTFPMSNAISKVHFHVIMLW
jgi:hypothetical protein